MNSALKGTPVERFSDYEPMGDAAYSSAGGGSYPAPRSTYPTISATPPGTSGSSGSGGNGNGA